MDDTKETDKIKKRYERRKSLPEKKIYSYFNPGTLFIVQERQRKIFSLLKKHGVDNLENRIILDVGCGSGEWLRDFIQWGATPENLYGIDLLKERIEIARKISPNANFYCTNAEKIDFAGNFFDTVIVSTCFTSILDTDMKKRIAQEISRVLKDNGVILWYDFRYNNPWNPDVKGIEKKEIKGLFGDCDYDFNLVTLAPPVSRHLAPISFMACEVLSKIPFLKTHYLAIIKKKQIK